MTALPGDGVAQEPRTPQGEGGDSGAAREALRDELVALVKAPHDHVYNTPTTAYAEAVADAILAAGFRRVAEDPDLIRLPSKDDVDEMVRIGKAIQQAERFQFEDEAAWIVQRDMAVAALRAVRGGEQQ